MKPDELEKIFAALLAELAQTYRCLPPPAGTVPTSAVETDCDAWLRQFVAQWPAIPPLPPALQPWIPVRILLALSALRGLAQDGVPLPPGRLQAYAEYFLITAWHRDLKFRWAMHAPEAQMGEN